jgi:hypothetical protein
LAAWVQAWRKQLLSEALSYSTVQAPQFLERCRMGLQQRVLLEAARVAKPGVRGSTQELP